MFENLQEKLQRAFKTLRGQAKLTEENIDEALREIRMALLEADVNFKVVKQLIDQIRAKAIGQEVMTALSPGEQVIKILRDELVEVLGKDTARVKFASQPPTVVLMAGFSWIIAATSLGRQQRACEQDMRMAALLGVNVDRTISLTFVMGASLAAVAGMLYLMYYGIIDFFIGFLAGIKAFTAAVLGGIGSLPGAMLGGLLIGVIEVFWAGYFSSEYKDVAAFSILVLVLIFRPTGLLGKPEIEKV